jgi:hypothetical protein
MIIPIIGFLLFLVKQTADDKRTLGKKEMFTDQEIRLSDCIFLLWLHNVDEREWTHRGFALIFILFMAPSMLLKIDFC